MSYNGIFRTVPAKTYEKNALNIRISDWNISLMSWNFTKWKQDKVKISIWFKWNNFKQNIKSSYNKWYANMSSYFTYFFQASILAYSSGGSVINGVYPL